MRSKADALADCLNVLAGEISDLAEICRATQDEVGVAYAVTKALRESLLYAESLFKDGGPGDARTHVERN